MSGIDDDRFASSFKCPIESVPKISIHINDDEASAATSKGKSKDKGRTDFVPDSYILFDKVMQSAGKELARDWLDLFLLRLNQVHDQKGMLYRALSDQMSDRKRRKSDNGGVLDEPTMMKCRLVSTLYDFEKSGIIKCSFADSSALKAIAISRHIYTWL